MCIEGEGGEACMCVCYVKDGKMELIKIGLELKQDWIGVGLEQDCSRIGVGFTQTKVSGNDQMSSANDHKYYKYIGICLQFPSFNKS